METNQNPTQNSRELLRWEAPRNPAHVRSPRWYLMGGVFVLSCAVYGIVTGQWSFTVVMILLAGMYVLTRQTPEEKLSMAITQEGVICKNEFTSWKDCVDFWMLEGPDYIELHIARRKRWGGEIIIQTGDQNPQTIRSTLGQFLQERSGVKERFLDTIIRICKL